MGEPAIASLAEQAFGEALPHGVTLAISFAIAYLITTSLHITLGEQVPKIYAIVAPRERGAPHRPGGSSSSGSSSARSSCVLNKASNGSCGWSASTPRREFDEASSSDDLKMLIARA